MSSANAAAMENPNLDLGSPLGGKPAPDVKLVNQFGQPMSLSQFRGRVVLLSFEDSECTTVCPLTTQSMVLAKELLGKAGNSVQLLGVDANPDAIKVSDVMDYSRVHGMINQWDFLTGSLAQLKSVWKSYNIAVQIESGQIDHTPALYVIDQQGRLQKVYLTQMAYSSVTQSAQVLATEVASLLPGHPKLSSLGSLGAIPAQTPTATVSLPAAAPAAGGTGAASAGTVTLGPGKARLVVFFATWLTETSDLNSELTEPQRLRQGRREQAPPRAHRRRRDRDRALGSGGDRLPAPARAAVLPGRPRRDGPGGGRLRRAGPALARPRQQVRQDHLAARRLGLPGDA